MKRKEKSREEEKTWYSCEYVEKYKKHCCSSSIGSQEEQKRKETSLWSAHRK